MSYILTFLLSFSFNIIVCILEKLKTNNIIVTTKYYCGTLRYFYEVLLPIDFSVSFYLCLFASVSFNGRGYVVLIVFCLVFPAPIYGQ